MTGFLLVGNASYRNRGCEAIVRGTMQILAETFGANLSVRSGVMGAPDVVAAQNAQEIDARVISFSVSQVGSRGSPKWWLAQANKRLGTGFQHHVWDLANHTQGAEAALQIGGDNYSLDYGRPLEFMAIDCALQRRNIPVVLWGASVGPFNKEPDFAARMFAHLRGLDGIFVREPVSRDYLRRNGVEKNVHQVADPAFLLKPSKPLHSEIAAFLDDAPIGLNLSPLVARFMGKGKGLDIWKDIAAELVLAVAERVRRPILLVPHVGGPLPGDDDFAFLQSVGEQVRRETQVPVEIVPDGFDAAELKWMISRCCVFVGARTHATIAALSSAVPTLSLSYSVKAQGLNEDLFGHREFCQSVVELTPERLVDGIKRLIEEGPLIQTHLRQVLPDVHKRASSAGPLLSKLLKRG